MPGHSVASVAARAILSPHVMAYARHVRERFPRLVAGTTVVDLDSLADDVCTSLDDFPLTTGVLGCTVFEHGEAYTAIREGLRRDQPARYRFTLAHEVSEILLRRYLCTLTDQYRRERICDAFAAELLLPHSAVLASVAVLVEAHVGGPGPSEATIDELARCLASTYDVSLTTARISVTECL
ncbi:MAG: ImmA/IrrE family metallo-endopeptidase [Candidatus Cryosericum sp.]